MLLVLRVVVATIALAACASPVAPQNSPLEVSAEDIVIIEQFPDISIADAASKTAWTDVDLGQDNTISTVGASLRKIVLPADLGLVLDMTVYGDNAIVYGLANPLAGNASTRATILSVRLSSGTIARWDGPKGQIPNVALRDFTFLAYDDNNSGSSLILVDLGVQIWALPLPGVRIGPLANFSFNVAGIVDKGIEAFSDNGSVLWQATTDPLPEIIKPAGDGVVTAGMDPTDSSLLGITWLDASGAITAKLIVKLPPAKNGYFFLTSITQGDVAVFQMVPVGIAGTPAIIVAATPGKLLWAKRFSGCTTERIAIDDASVVVNEYAGGNDLWNERLALADGKLLDVQKPPQWQSKVVAIGDLLVQIHQDDYDNTIELWITDRWNNATEADSGACRDMPYGGCAADSPEKVIGCHAGKCLPSLPGATCLPTDWTGTTP